MKMVRSVHLLLVLINLAFLHIKTVPELFQTRKDAF